MLRFLSFFTFIQSIMAQFRDPILTIRPPPTVPVLTIGSIAPIRTIPTITRPNDITNTSITTTILTTTPITTFLPQSTEPNNLEEFDTNLLFLIIPSGLLLVFFAYLCFKKRKHNVNVVNIDLNIENSIPQREEPVREEPVREEPERIPSNLSEHFYEEINYEARYEMPNIQNANITENEYGKQVTTSV
mgnify:CR=1 FL=1